MDTSDDMKEWLFQEDYRAMMREVGEILGYPAGWRG